MQRIHRYAQAFKRSSNTNPKGFTIERIWLSLREKLPSPNLRIMSYNLLAKTNIMEHHFPYHSESELDALIRNKKLRE